MRILSLIAFLFLLWAASPYLPVPHTIVWKATLVATEFGHFLAAAGLLLFSATLLLADASKSKKFSAICFFASTLTFLVPTVQFQFKAREWTEQIEKEFGTSLQPLSMNFARLFGLGEKISVLPPQAFVFDDNGKYQLSLDLYRAKNSAKAPWVLMIHGGSWNSGEREQLKGTNEYFAEHGISVVAISYRLAPHWLWPAPREDALSAVRFVKANAEKMGVDPERWVVFGRSAGGHIAESVAYFAKDPTLKGCIALYAPADLNFAYQFGSRDDVLDSLSLMRALTGGSPEEKPEVYNDASPIRFVSAASPPTLLLHGPRDPLVWYRQSERLIKVLQDNKVKAALVTIPWATHGFDFNLKGPGGQIFTQSAMHFLKSVFQER